VSTRNTCVYRFGAFEFDLRAAELRKNGVRLKIQDQPRQVLLELLQRPGEVVTREELRSLLWKENTFVDFETGLNTAVKRLRETLGDSADNPTFVVTLPRRGYKFIAPVEASPGGNGLQALVIDQPAASRATPRSKVAYVVVVSLLLLLLGLFYWRSLLRVPTVTNAVRISNDAKPKIPASPFVTDGVHLYFVEGAPWTGGSQIAQMSATGGETTPIVTSLKEVLYIQAISPDGSQLLVANGDSGGADPSTGRPESGFELWMQPLPAGTPHRVGNIYATGACWTPDGKHILYADGHVIMIVNTDGSNPHALAKVPFEAGGLRYSPDGLRIRFFTGWPDSGALWELDANGTNLHPLLPDWKESPFQCCGNWSPDGNYYYFQGGTGDNQTIWVIPEHRFISTAARPTPSRLISGPLPFSAPVPARDGKRVFVIGQELRVESVRYDSKTQRFDSYLNGISAGSSEVSPDRKWIAYVSYPELSLWRSRADGSEKMQLTFPPVRVYGPRWSPDGSRIVFMNVQFSQPWKVSVVSSSGGAPQSLPSENADEIQADPSWMPDGKSIVFARSQKKEGDAMAISRLDLQSGKVVSIPNAKGLFSPRVSPDGRFISAFNHSQTELMLFDAHTNRWSSLAKGEDFGCNLWSHDGKYVYMRASAGGASKLVRVRINDGALESVVTLKDFPQPVDLYTAWFGLTPDDAPILIRDRGVQEIYALDLQ
jgi:Tol biopolymer transport system component/DNA-binding winged helix-turn-helix (wHTH) protein